jgi:hypothetical protein
MNEMKTLDQSREIETELPSEIVHPSVDSLSEVFRQVREDATTGAKEYLQDTIVSEGGE